MTPLAEALLATAAASACIPLGGLLALLARRKKKWLDAEVRHFVVALGGGILIAAVSLVLLPEGMQRVQEPLAVAALFVAGGAACFVLERRLGASHSESPQLAATLLDYVPESLALGGHVCRRCGFRPAAGCSHWSAKPARRFQRLSGAGGDW